MTDFEKSKLKNKNTIYMFPSVVYKIINKIGMYNIMTRNVLFISGNLY